MTEVEAQKIVTMLVTAYPSTLAKLDAGQQADTRKIYREMILDIDSQVAAQAVRALIATSRFLPTIAELREACVNAKFGRRRPGGDAWGDVVRAMKRYGYTRTPGVDFQFDDPIVARSVGAMGWPELCGSTNSIADRARFTELYDALTGNERGETQAAHALVAPSQPRALEGRSMAQLLVAAPAEDMP